MFIRPWNKESKNIILQLHRNNGKATTINRRLPQEFGKKYPDLFDRGFLDVASTRYSKRRDKTLFMTPPDIVIEERGKTFHFKRIKII